MLKPLQLGAQTAKKQLTEVQAVASKMSEDVFIALM